MLEYYPQKRASARDLLRHPWLTMPADFDFKISEIEIEKMKMIKNNKKVENEEEEDKKDNLDREVYSSDSELYGGDNEDNDKGDIYNEIDEFFKEIKNELSKNNEFNEDDSGDDNPDKVNIPNFNNSFAEYGQFVDLTSLDRANPQFNKIMKSE